VGFFDRFSSSTAFREIVAAYGLTKAQPYEPSLMLPWWEGLAGTTRFAIQEAGQGLNVYVGDIVEVTEIYLVRAGEGTPLPPKGTPMRLDTIAGRDSPLARTFFLAAYPIGDFDYPQLRIPAVAQGLLALSPGVGEVMICENFRGLSFIEEPPPSREIFDRDLQTAIAVVKALERGSA